MQETCHDNISEHYSCDRQKFPHSLPKNILWSFLFLLNTTSSTYPESELNFRKLCRKRAMTILIITSHYSCDRQKFPNSLPKNILRSFLFLLNTTSSTFPESKLKFRKLCRKRAMTIFMFPSHYSCDRQKFPHSLPKNILWSFLFLLNNTSSTYPESKLKFRKLCMKRAMTIFLLTSHYICDPQKVPCFLTKTIVSKFLFLLTTTSSTFPESKL